MGLEVQRALRVTGVDVARDPGRGRLCTGRRGFGELVRRGLGRSRWREIHLESSSAFPTDTGWRRGPWRDALKRNGSGWDGEVL